MIAYALRLKCCGVLLAALAAAPLAASAQARPLSAQPRPLAVEPQSRSQPLPGQPMLRQLPGQVQVRQLPVQSSQPVTRYGNRPQSGRTPNAVYGTIAAIAGTTVTIRTRGGQLRLVDAGPALAAGTFSAPLYIGKSVVAEGLSRVNGVLTAIRLSRLTTLDRTNPDR